jgi:hypothetical protein
VKTIVIDGIEYELVPIKPSGKRNPPQSSSSKELASQNTLLEEYEGIKVAKPEIYDWKEEMAKKRKKQMQNTMLRRIPKQRTEIDNFGNLVVGKGIEEDF